jgi:hypothetical protein
MTRMQSWNLMELSLMVMAKNEKKVIMICTTWLNMLIVNMKDKWLWVL